MTGGDPTGDPGRPDPHLPFGLPPLRSPSDERLSNDLADAVAGEWRDTGYIGEDGIELRRQQDVLTFGEEQGVAAARQETT